MKHIADFSKFGFSIFGFFQFLSHFFLYLLLSMLAFLSLSACQRTTPVSREVLELQEKVKADSDNMALVASFITQAMREQQLKQASRANVEIIESILLYGEAYLQSQELNKDDDSLYVATYHAQAHFFRASIYNAKGQLLEASKQVERGFEHFETLVEQFSQSILVRAYRAINYANLPKLFETEDTVQEDIVFIKTLLLDKQYTARLKSDVFLHTTLIRIFTNLDDKDIDNAASVYLQLSSL